MRKQIAECTLRALLAGILTFGTIQAWAAESPDTRPAPTTPSAASTKAAPEGQASNPNTVETLEKKIAAQQEQIEKLTRAVELLTDRLNATAQEPKKAESKKTQDEANTGSVGQVTSLVPVIPKSAATASSSLPALSAPPATPPAAAKSPQKQEHPEAPSFANGKIKIGATFFGLYRYYTDTGFGPQILTLLNTPGPGNGGFNSFDVDRTYVSLFYSPTDALTLRITPNIYRQFGAASGQKLSKDAGTGSTENGNLLLRIKYAYVDFNKPFANSAAFGKDTLTFGQQQQPLTDWEEGLYGYRFVNLTPWNYLSLSSTYPGVKLHGPIELNGKQYFDYEVGVFNDQSFHAYETGDKKQVMARLSYYPFGAVSKYQGLGLTGFVDYGYKDAAPDLNSNVPITRVAALVHYQSKSGDYGIAGEYDYGRNAFSLGNLYSGSGPADAFGLGPTPYATFNSMAAALLAGSHTNQQGLNLFGHARIAKSPFYLFGILEQFQPNTNVNHDPLDFRTIIAGISYKYTKYWEFALDTQNVVFYHNQFTFPASQLAKFNPSLAAANPNGIPNAVPSNTHAIFFNILFNY
jgi:uncharacterized coiled-coil protein SlyX